MKKLEKSLLLALVVLSMMISSCSDYTKLLKSTDYNKKYDAAIAFYDNKDYNKALALLQELVSVYRGTAKAEKIMYYYAYSTYAVGDYLLAGYHFSVFVKTFPASDKTEDCAFMYAYCYYLESPRYSLDQTDTKSAIKELQYFINKYPESKRKQECNDLITTLRAKLEEKYYRISRQYYFLDDYQAAITSFENVLKDFPDTRYREEIMFMILKANYTYATKSIETKQLDRLKATLEAYNKFVSYFQNSEYQKDAENIYKNALRLKEQLAFEIPFHHFEMGRYDEAVEGLKSAMAWYPENDQKEKAHFTILSSHYHKAIKSTGYSREKNINAAGSIWHSLYANLTSEGNKKIADAYYNNLTAERTNLPLSVPKWFFANGKYSDAIASGKRSIQKGELSVKESEELSYIIFSSYDNLYQTDWKTRDTSIENAINAYKLYSPAFSKKKSNRLKNATITA